MKRVAGWLAYPAALALGMGYVAWLFPWAGIWPADPLHTAFFGDAAVSVVGQRYFLAAPWGWPLLNAPRLAAPAGTNIALTDSIPLAMLAAKAMRAWLPPGFFVVSGWVALVWGLQPAAAVFALRGAGERRAAPALAVAALSVCMPTLLMRYGHTALCSHAAILAAIGLYLRLTAGPCRWTWWAATLLPAACLLIHPYILVFVIAALAAVPVSLLLRPDARWRVAATWLAGTCAMIGLGAVLLGFGGTVPAPGYGVYSMNLLGPLLPSRSSLLPNVATDPTGGQASEGFQYLGAGLLALLAAAVAAGGRLGWRRHAGLALVLAALALFALSNKVYAGHRLLLHFGAVPPIVEQFRATGRFFWPVAYAALIAAVMVVSRAVPPRLAMAVLACSVALQAADTWGMQRNLRRFLHAPPGWTIDLPVLTPIFAAHDRLALWPSFGCGAATLNDRTMQVMLLASQTTMRTNTMFSARTRDEPDCDPAAVLAPPLAPGELRVVQRHGNAWLVPGAPQRCHAFDQLVLCSAAALEGLPALAPLSPPLRTDLAFPALTDAIGAGWSATEPDGVWSDAATATLLFQRPAPGRLLLTVHGVGFATPGGAQSIAVTADGAAVATWQAPDMVAGTFEAELPAGSGLLTVALHIARPARPSDRGMNGDTRQLGFLLRGLRLDPAP